MSLDYPQRESHLLRDLGLWLFLLMLAGCGPKDIGQGSSHEAAIIPEASGADLMRLPMTGMNNTQRMLYWQNRPDVMEGVQNWRINQARKQMGIAPEDPAYRETPKQHSPFRQ